MEKKISLNFNKKIINSTNSTFNVCLNNFSKEEIQENLSIRIKLDIIDSNSVLEFFNAFFDFSSNRIYQAYRYVISIIEIKGFNFENNDIEPLHSISDINFDQNEEIKEIREQIFFEFIKYFSKYEKKIINVAYMRQKVNEEVKYALVQMHNDLVDQQIIIDYSKLEKKELDDKDSRYAFTLKKLQNFVVRQKKYVENEQLKIAPGNAFYNKNLKKYLKIISVKKIEAYINKTFYIYFHYEKN